MKNTSSIAKSLSRFFFVLAMLSMLSTLAQADTNSVKSIKLRLGVSSVKITPNGCVAVFWAGGKDFFTKEWVKGSIERHIGGDIEPSQISTPLMAAVARNEIDKVTTILNRGSNPDATNEAGCTALIWAISLGRTEIFDLLVDAGAKVSLADATGRTPLMIAASAGSIPIAEELIDRGANVNTAQDGGVNEIGQTALMHAATTNQNVAMLELLIQHGAELEAVDEHGETALIKAAQVSLENVKFLVVSGSDTSARTAKGSSALDHARQWERTGIVEYLKGF